MINLSALVAYEGVPLHAPYFAKLWYEIYQSEQVDKDCVTMLCGCSSFIDYVDAVLLDERQSLNNQHIYQFFCTYFPKVRSCPYTSRFIERFLFFLGLFPIGPGAFSFSSFSGRVLLLSVLLSPSCVFV